MGAPAAHHERDQKFAARQSIGPAEKTELVLWARAGDNLLVGGDADRLQRPMANTYWPSVGASKCWLELYWSTVGGVKPSGFFTDLH